AAVQLTYTRNLQEVDLPADRPYVFGYHPHGIIGMGAFATFATESTGFSKAFPGIKPHLLTLASNFHIPLYRDLLLSLGICSVSKKSCINILSSGPGSAITIVIGGAAESLAARPGTAGGFVLGYQHCLKDSSRLQFNKELPWCPYSALEKMMQVLIYEHIYDQLSNEKGTTIYKMQKTFQRIFGFTLPLFHGRGLLTYNVGLLPFRHPIVSVVGRPIAVTQSDKPTKEYMEQIQAQYIEELMRIWDTYKDTYARERTSL
ncbi:diacylglycerol O-acyltransferase 1, partial [Tulasnella sp. 417]